jgi:hypothetical protein
MVQQMMKTHKWALLLLVATCFSSQSCLKDTCLRTVSYTQLVPVYVSLDEIRASNPELVLPQPIVKPGSVAHFQNKIFLGELGQGIHIIDNADPNNPVNSAFIAIPGNTSFAISNGILYASSYIDLLTIDLTGGSNSTPDGLYGAASRVENVFSPLWEDLDSNRIAITYEERQQTSQLDCDSYGAFLTNRNGKLVEIVQLDEFKDSPEFFVNNAATDTSNQYNFHQAISTQFTITGDFLYALNLMNLNVLSLTNPLNPVEVNSINIGTIGPATLAPFKDDLFVGASYGATIYSLGNPNALTAGTFFGPASACDAFSFKDNYVFVAKRSGNKCYETGNQLCLVDITHIETPNYVQIFPMDNPHGLTIVGETLFLCEGEFGLKSFDITSPLELDQHLLDHETGLHALSVLILDEQAKLLLVNADDGLYQYNFDNPANLKLLSKLAFD